MYFIYTYMWDLYSSPQNIWIGENRKISLSYGHLNLLPYTYCAIEKTFVISSSAKMYYYSEWTLTE